MKHWFMVVAIFGSAIILSVAVVNRPTDILIYAKYMKVDSVRQVNMAKTMFSRYALVDRTVGMSLNNMNNATISNSTIIHKPFDDKLMIIRNYTGE